MSVIERIHVLAKGMPALPIFTDRSGQVIGDVENEFLHNINDEDNVEPSVDNNNLPGVHTAEADDEIPGVDMVQEQDVDVDLDFAPADEGNVNPPLVDIPPPVNDAPVVSNVPTDGGTRKSTRVRMQPKPQYIPAFCGKSYSFATTALGTRMLDDVDYSYNQSVAFSFVQQLSVKAALREWGDDAKVAGEKEVNQLHWRETFVPRQMSELTPEQQSMILQSHMFIGQKRTEETNSRGKKSLLVECYNAIYGTMVAGLLYYHKFSSGLKKRGFTVNPYDPCFWNRDIKGKQMMICFHVNDCKISHLDPKVVDYTIAWLREE